MNINTRRKHCSVSPPLSQLVQFTIPSLPFPFSFRSVLVPEGERVSNTRLTRARHIPSSLSVSLLLLLHFIYLPPVPYIVRCPHTHPYHHHYHYYSHPSSVLTYLSYQLTYFRRRPLSSLSPPFFVIITSFIFIFINHHLHLHLHLFFPPFSFHFISCVCC